MFQFLRMGRALAQGSLLVLTTCALLVGSLTVSAWAAAPAAGAKFLSVEAENVEKDDFVFPDDIKGEGVQVLFLGMATDREGGERQSKALMEWYDELVASKLVPASLSPWHLTVMPKPPFFVKGMIRKGMAETFEGKAPLSQVAPLYVKDMEGFAQAAGLPLDNKPTVVLYSAADGIMAVFKGEVSPEAIAGIRAVVAPAPVAKPEPVPTEPKPAAVLKPIVAEPPIVEPAEAQPDEALLEFVESPCA